MLALQFVVLGAGPTAVALAEPQLGVIEQAIVGGRETRAEAPSPTALIGSCDATLIAPDLLLTAAHCLEDEVPESARFGASEEQATLMVSIAACAKHPDYPSREGSDIAYCWLFDQVDEVEPAQLDSGCAPEATPREGDTLLLRGHGYLTAAQQEARVEREVEVLVGAVQADGRELLVGDREHGGCKGDSGGSAFGLRSDGGLVLTGVISRRGPSADGSVPENCASTTVVTRVAPHLAWLAQATGEVVDACAPPPPHPYDAQQDLFAEAPTQIPGAPVTAPSSQQLPDVAPAANAGCMLARTTSPSAAHRALWLTLLMLAMRRACRTRVGRPRRDRFDLSA